MKTSTDDLLDYTLARLREGPRLARIKFKEIIINSGIEGLSLSLKSI